MRAARVDRNQADIVDALKRAGVTVQHLHSVGGGCPDIIAGVRGVNYLIEIKHPKDGSLTIPQVKWHSDWKGQVHIACSEEDALRIVGLKT